MKGFLELVTRRGTPLKAQLTFPWGRRFGRKKKKEGRKKERKI